ncbi:MAG: serine/threonine protein kinase [Rudaea sp.]
MNPQRTRDSSTPAPGEEPVEVSRILPARFATADAHTLREEEAPTLPVAGSAPTVARATPATHAFHYTVIGTAGAGGMGTVHIARDTELLRRVALKQLNADADANDSARTRFLREAQITAQLDHPNIVPVYALEVAPGGTPAYTMKFVEGRTFHSLLNEARDFFSGGKWPDETRSLASRLEHFLKVCDAIAYAHDKGAIHRDLKPANLMLGRHNEVYVMDWGLCRILRQPDDTPPDKSVVMSTPDTSGSASETRVGDVVGTPKYMAPEQAQGRNDALDARSDQCALGLILYEIVTLNPPYEGRTAYEVLANAAAGKRRPIVHAYLRRRIPRELAAVIERATAFKPENRYPDVAALAADIRRYLRGEAVQAQPDSLMQRAQRWIVRHRQAALNAVFGIVAVAAVAIGGLLWLNQRQFVAERLREQRLLQLRDAVADVGDHVQTRMLQLEGAIQNLADSVGQIDEFGRPSDDKYYLLRDFRDATRAPPDLTPSMRYGGRFSLNWPVWTIPPGMAEAAALPTIRKMSALRHFRRDLYLRTAAIMNDTQADLYKVRIDPATNPGDDNPLSAIMIGFADGIASRYPGWDALPADYDPRQHPWYRLAVGKYGPQWSDPYWSSITRRSELALSVPVYVGDKRLAAVVSALLLPDKLVQHLLDIAAIPGLRGVYLIDEEGHVLAASGAPLAPVAADSAPENAVLPVPELLRRIRRGETGILETTFHGQPAVLAFDEITPLDWHVVAVADPKQLLRSSAQMAR